MRYRVLYGRVVIECDDPQDAVFIAESIAKRDGFACGNPVDNEIHGPTRRDTRLRMSGRVSPLPDRATSPGGVMLGAWSSKRSSPLVWRS